MTCEKSKQRGIVTNITAVIVLSGYDAKQNSSQQSAKRNKDKVNLYLYTFVVNELHHAAGLAYPQSVRAYFPRLPAASPVHWLLQAHKQAVLGVYW